VTDTAREFLTDILFCPETWQIKTVPAIDVLASVSRVMPDIVDDEHQKIANDIKKTMAIYREAEDLINVGAYAKGSNEKLTMH